MQRTIQSICSQDKFALESALGIGGQSALIEVQCLLQKVLNITRAYLFTYPEQCLTQEEESRYQELLRRRLRGEPIAYLLGEREFFGLMFKVTPSTLIPRPETELLVELSLKLLSERTVASPDQRSTNGDVVELSGNNENYHVLDLGTGTGAIGLSIAHALPNLKILAVDSSLDSLAVANENSQRLHIKNVAFKQSNWYDALHGQLFHLIVSNPPYIANGDPHLKQGDLRFEPQSALASGVDGLKDIRKIISGSTKHLHFNGWLLLEHGYDQATQVRELLLLSGYINVFSARDLAGVERVSGGRLADLPTVTP